MAVSRSVVKHTERQRRPQALEDYTILRVIQTAASRIPSTRSSYKKKNLFFRKPYLFEPVSTYDSKWEISVARATPKL